jgi:hypothetical protein
VARCKPWFLDFGARPQSGPLGKDLSKPKPTAAWRWCELEPHCLNFFCLNPKPLRKDLHTRSPLMRSLSHETCADSSSPT